MATRLTETYNHYPLIGRTPPRGCSLPGDTANPFATITCPSCRDRLARKVALEEGAASEPGITAGERKMHTGTAAMFAQVLAA